MHLQLRHAGWVTVALCAGCGWSNPVAGPVLLPGEPAISTDAVAIGCQNPVMVSCTNREFAWDQIVDVIDDYFRIEREQRVRLVGNVLTEGRIDTYPQDGATYLEPHLRDSVGPRNRLESTLQSIRRRAVVRVVPTEGGYLVDVAVYQQLEDVPSPEHATAGSATFRYDQSSSDRAGKLDQDKAPRSWIDQGRDVALEQEILSQIQARFVPSGPPIVVH